MGIRTPQTLPEGPAEGGARGVGLRGPYAHRSASETGPDRQNGLAPHTPHHPCGGRRLVYQSDTRPGPLVLLLRAFSK